MVMFHAFWTLVLFLVFIGIIFWAFSSKSKKSFDAASRIPLEEDAPVEHTDRS
jgi:cytochrome c oxidase cbb3-type subunit 4